MNDPITNGLSGLADLSAPDPGAVPSSPMNLTLPQPAAPVSGNVNPGPVNPGTGQAVSPGAQPQPSARPALPAPSGPHAGLMSMIQGMMLGMDAFATSAATGGREGGVQEVLQAQAAKQEMALKQRQDAREEAVAGANIQHLQALTNSTIAQNEILKMNAPLEHQKLVIDNQKSLYDLYTNILHINPLFAVPIVQGQGTDTHMAGINAQAKGDLVNNTVIPVHDGDVGGSGNSYGFSFDQLRKVNVPIEQAAPVLTNLQNQIDYARQVLPDGDKNPSIKAAQGQLDALKKGSTVNGYDFFVFDNLVQSQILQKVAQQSKIQEFQKQQADALKAKQDADPLFKLENDPSQMAGEKSSAAIPMLQNKMTDPATAPADKVRASRLLAVAQSAHARFLQDQVQKANAEQQAKQGDPRAAGAMLASGDLTLQDMKTRGMTPDFIVKTINAAKAVDPNYRPADEMIAEQAAKSPTNVQFFGSGNSLIAKGGTLDQLIQAGSKLPNHTFPVFNSIADARNYATGHPEVASYLLTALGVADDYAKVVGGGNPSEGMQMLTLNKLTAANNQQTRVDQTNAIRGTVNSQLSERIGTNKFMNRMYGYALPQNQPKAPAGATMKVPGSDGRMHWSDGKQDLGVVQ